MNILLKFKENCVGSPNGISIKKYSKGQIEEVEEELSKVFLKQGWAEEYSEEKETEDKQIPGAPNNKMEDLEKKKDKEKKKKDKDNKDFGKKE